MRMKFFLVLFSLMLSLGCSKEDRSCCCKTLTSQEKVDRCDRILRKTVARETGLDVVNVSNCWPSGKDDGILFCTVTLTFANNPNYRTERWPCNYFPCLEDI